MDSLTVQWCVISEGLVRSTHPKGPGGFGALISTNGAVSFHHNLLAHHLDRAPYFQMPGSQYCGVQTADVRNNLIHGARARAGRSVRLNHVGNCGLLGVKMTAYQKPACRIYAEDNQGIEIDGGVPVSQPFDAPLVQTHEANDVWDVVLENAGATLPARNAVDRRIVSEVRTGVTRTIDTPGYVGGWPALETAPGPIDTTRTACPTPGSESTASGPRSQTGMRIRTAMDTPTSRST